MENQQQVQIQLDPNMYALTMANIMFDEEQFVFMMAVGNQGRRYVLSPKHAKRFAMLLDKQIKDYEAKFGELQTALPETSQPETSSHRVGFTNEG